VMEVLVKPLSIEIGAWKVLVATEFIFAGVV